MFIAVRFGSKSQLIIHDEPFSEDRESIKITTNWKFYPKQIQVFREALSKSEFHNNFIHNVIDFVSLMHKTDGCEQTIHQKITLRAMYQRIPDFIDIAW